MTRKLLVLSCAAAALIGGVAMAQDTAVNPPADQTDLETQAQNANEADRLPLAQPSVNDQAATPAAGDVSARIPPAQVSTDGVWTTQSQGAAATGVAVNPPVNDQASVAETTDTAADVAQTPASQPASASVSSMAYATNIANAPNGVFRPVNIGNYPMSHYASPSRPLPYDQVDGYIRASRSQQLAQNWWAGSELASTAASSDVSASTPASSDVSSTTNTSAASAATASGTAGLPGDTRVGLNSDTSTSNSGPTAAAPGDTDVNTASTTSDSTFVTSPSSTPSNSPLPNQETTTPSGLTTP